MARRRGVFFVTRGYSQGWGCWSETGIGWVVLDSLRCHELHHLGERVRDNALLPDMNTMTKWFYFLFIETPTFRAVPILEQDLWAILDRPRAAR